MFVYISVNLLKIEDKLKVCVQKFLTVSPKCLRSTVQSPSGRNTADDLAALVASSVSQRRKHCGSLSISFSMFLLVFSVVC